MAEEEEKLLHRAFVQMTDGVTMVADTGVETTEEQTRSVLEQSFHLSELDDKTFHRVIVLPITTKTRWEGHAINFCPRCGRNLTESQYHSYGRIRCMDCNIMADIEIHKLEGVEE